MSVTDLRARQGNGSPDDDPFGPGGEAAGRSIADRAEDGDAEGDAAAEQEELFVLEQGERVTLSKLISRGTTVEYRFNLNSKGLAGGPDMGLVAFSQPELMLVVPVRAGKVVVDPSYGDDGTVSKVRVTAHFKPRTAYDARSANGRAALGLEG